MVSFRTTSILCFKAVTALSATPNVLILEQIKESNIQSSKLKNGLVENHNPDLKNDVFDFQWNRLHLFLLDNELFIEKTKHMLKFTMENDSEIQKCMEKIFSSISATRLIETLLQETITAEDTQYLSTTFETIKLAYNKLLEEEPECILLGLDKDILELYSSAYNIILLALDKEISAISAYNISDRKVQNLVNVFYNNTTLRNFYGFILHEICHPTQDKRLISEEVRNYYMKSINEIREAFGESYIMKDSVNKMYQAAISKNAKEFDLHFHNYINIMKKFYSNNANFDAIPVLETVDVLN
ncbi:hypothetical protein GINT2_000541 [Glugoides intestinalis]